MWNYNENEVTLSKSDLKDKSIKIFVHHDKEKPLHHSRYLQLIEKKSVQKSVLSTFDTLLALLLLAPCVVGFWRGTWVLMDIYNKYLPPWLCLLLGLSTHIIFVLTQDTLNAKMKECTTWRAKICNMILIRIYIYIFAISSNMHWRGGWEFIDSYFGIKKDAFGTILKEGSGNMLITAAGTLVCIIALKSLRNCISPPFLFCIDKKDKTFEIPTRFKTKMSESTSLYVLDCLFSVLVIGTLVVFVWRGAWALIDIYLFPENEVWSSWGSLIVGYAAVAIAFMLQPFMRWLCDRITGVGRLLVADLFLILSLIGTVNVWRGIWNLLNIYLLPENQELSCWITHWVCLIVLILLGCSNSLLVRGVYIDAEEPAGKCVVFPCYYLRLIFQEQKLKKIQNEQNKTEMLNVKPAENNHVVSISNANEQCPQNLIVNHVEGKV